MRTGGYTCYLSVGARDIFVKADAAGTEGGGDMRPPRTRHDPDVSDVENVLKALADGTRLRILGLLAAGENCVCNLQESLRVPQSKVSRHLAYLRRAKLVETRRDGLWIYYRIAPPATPVVAVLLSAIRHCITHLGTSQQDLRRLWERTGCCEPPVEALPAPPPCCAGRPGASERPPADASGTGPG